MKRLNSANHMSKEKENNNKRKAAGMIVVILILAVHFSQPMQDLKNFPGEIRVAVDREKSIGLNVPFITIHSPDENILQVRRTMGERQPSMGFRSLSLTPISFGNVTLEFRLLGLIPLKRMSVSVVPSLYLTPGGQSIGVLLHSQGVIITGFRPVVDPKGRQSCPAREAGLNPGDVILEVNGQACRNEESLLRVVNSLARTGNEIRLKVKRKEGPVDYVIVNPVLSQDTARYQIGIVARDTTAGVGTLTFYHEPTGVFGALGHMISDATGDSPLEVTDGRIVRATVTGINEGTRGHPGEKIGLFIEERDVIGTIQRNSRFGIFGLLNRPSANPFFPEPIPVAMAHEVKPGPAELYTVIKGGELERFQIEVQKVFPQTRPDDKSMIVKITDPRLLRYAGGIVQGMSGSPIVQNGKLVGAITHVFVNDPTRGYGVFIEWMIEDSGYVQLLQTSRGKQPQTTSSTLTRTRKHLLGVA